MTIGPDCLTDRAGDEPNDRGSGELEPDTLSRLLAGIRIQGRTPYQASMTAPWRLRFPAGAAHVLYLTRGAATLVVPDAGPVAMTTGDLLLLPFGMGHEISDGGALQVDGVAAFDPAVFDPGRLMMSNSGTGPRTILVGGPFTFDRHPLAFAVRSVPSVIRLQCGDQPASDWSRALTKLLLDEGKLQGPGAALIVSRIIDLLVIRILRNWVITESAQSNWIAAAGEDRLSRAIAAIHEQPGRRWNIRELATLTAMSRSVFTQRFGRAFGESPMRYITRWRFSVAVDLLTTSDLTIGDIARRVGYDSEAGFSRAFKAIHGRPPSGFRLRRRSGTNDG
jgi:AraC-like DNA-binding protein